MSEPSVLVYMNLGPYHIARLRALTEVVPNMHAIEVAGKQRLYPWRPSRDELGFSLTTLFPDCASENVRAAAQRNAMRAALSRINPAVVMVAGYREPVMRAAAAWAWERGVPTILCFVSTYLDAKRRWWKESIKRRLIRRYAAIAATGERAGEYALRLGARLDRVYRIGNVVDNAHYAKGCEIVRRRQSQERKRLHLPARFFLTVSRLSPEKNLTGLLDAFFQYRKQGGTWDLVLVGSGPQEQTLRGMAQDHLEKQIHFVPWARYEELPHYYGSASCFVLPSVSEPWGLVVNEAMASGLPVLVSENCGCVPELCREGENGYSFNPESVEELAQHMLRISASEGQLEAFGKASRRTIAEFTLETWAEKLKECVIMAMKERA